VVGPMGVSLGRQEIRLSIPVGFAVLFGEQKLIFGVEPWFVLAQTSHAELDPVVPSYTTAGFGVGFMLGVAFR
jgi:hypothetical protein